MNASLRVLIVDDSQESRRLLRGAIERLPGVVVVAEAGAGDEGLVAVAKHSPDLLLLDLEMPRMDGFTFLRLLMAKRPTPVVVVSGHSKKDNVFKALELGAIDFVAKPLSDATTDAARLQSELAEKVAMIRQLAPTTAWGQGHDGLSLTGRFAPVAKPPSKPPVETTAPSRVIVFGASTGGPSALVQVFSELTAIRDRAAAVVVQHMPPKFTTAFAERLNRIGIFRVREATGVEPLRAGAALVCPGGKCAEIVEGTRGPCLRLVPPSADDQYTPSINRLFRTAASTMGDRVIAVVLTGMGTDGTDGALSIKQSGGKVICESGETAVVYGMPRAVAAAGAADDSVPLSLVSQRLRRYVDGNG